MSRSLRTFSVIAIVMGVVFLGTPVSAAVAIDVPSPPSAPVATVVKDTSVTFTWAAPTATGGAPVTSYEILKDGTPVATTAGRVFTLSPLEGGSMVSITVKACNVVGCSFDSDALIVTTKPAPASALRLSPGNAVIAVSWVESPTIGIGDHSLWYRTNTTSAWTEWTPGVADTTGTVITGLQNGTTYIVKIRTTSSKGWNDTASAIATPMDVPARPTVFYTRISPTAVVLAWTWPATTTAVPRHFDVYKDGEKVVTTTGRYQAVVKLTPLTAYSFTVTACNVAGCSSPAPPLNVTLPPPPATGVTLTPGINKLSVSWVPSPTASYHSLWYKILGASSWTEHTPGVPDVTPVDLNGLVGGSMYVIRVGAHNSSAIATYSPLVAAMPIGVPAAPTAVQQVSAGRTSADISWPTPFNGGSAITSYKLFVNGVLSNTLTAPANSFSVAGLLEGGSYTVTLQACNVVGCSSDSNTLVSYTAPPAALTVTATPASTSAIITWAAPTASALTGYRVFYRQVGRPIWLQLSSAAFDSSGVVLPGLNIQTSYEVFVRTYNPVSYTDSVAVPFSTSYFVAPSPPQNVTATAGLSSARLSWTAPSSNGGSAVTNYTIEYSSDSGTTWTSYTKPVSTTLGTSVVGLSAGLTYSFRVAAVNVAGSSAPQVATSSVTPFGAPNAPTTLTAVPGLSRVTLSWVAPGNNGGSPITDYVIQYSTNNSTWTTFSDGASTSTSAAVTGLTNGVPYYFKVAAMNSGGVGAYASVASAVTPVAAPTEPTRVVGSPGNGSVSLSWSPPTSTGGTAVTDYSVQYSSDSGATWVAFSDGLSTQTTASISGLTNGVSYVFRVAATNSSGTGTFSATSLPVTPRGFPQAPTAATAIAGNASASVSWVAPTVNGGNAISDYLVQYSSNAGTTWTTFADGVKTTTTATVTGLVNGTSYVFRVAAVNGAGAGAYSANTAAVIPKDVPGAPTGLVGAPGDKQVALSWVAPSSTGGSPVTDYSILLSLDAGATWVPFIEGVSTSLSATVTGLTNGSSYIFKVAAVNAAGTGAYSLPTAAVLVDPTLTSPTNVSGDAGDSSVFLTWTAPARTTSPVTDYVVQHSVDGGVSWTSYAHAVSTAPWLSMSGLANGTSYVFRVAAVTALGVGSYSAPSSSVTPHGGASAVQNLVGTPANAAVALSWEYPASDNGFAVTSYSISRSSNGGSTWALVTTLAAPASSYLVSGLVNGTPYQFKVLADNGSGGVPTTTAATPGTVPGAPTGVSATNSGSAVNLTWTAPSSNGGYAVTNYSISYSSDSGTTWTAVSRPISSATSAAVSGLTVGTTYSFRVAAINALGTGLHSATSSSLNVKTAPDAPVNLAAAPGNATASLTWIAPASDGGAPVTNYIIQYSTTSGTSWTAFSRGASTAANATVTSLTNGTSYVFRVAAVNAIGTSAWSSVSSVVNPSSTPGVVQGTAASPSDSQVTLSWSPPASFGGSAITDYSVQFSADGGVNWSLFADGVSTAQSATITGLTNGTSYLFRVAASNQAGTGAFANPVAATPRTTPDAPANVVGTTASASVALSWDAPASNGGSAITTYAVEYSSDSGSSWVSFAHAASSSSSLTVTGLTNGTSYTFRVAAVNAAGTGAFSPHSASYIPGSILGAPTMLSGTGHDQSVNLTWVAPTAPAGVAILDYTIAFSLDNGATWTTLNDGVSSATSAVVTGLTNGTSYVFKVAATTAGGTGSYSSPTTALTPRTVPGTPGTPSTSTSDASVALSWTAPASNGGASITGYSVLYSSDAGVSWNSFSHTASSATSLTVTGLINGTSYIFKVAAENAAGTGSYSAYSAPATPLSSPSAPSAVTAIAGDAEASLSWVAPASNGGAAITDYVVQHSTNAGATWVTFSHAASSSTNLTVTGLINGTSYVFRVAAVNSVGTSAYSSSSSSVSPVASTTVPGAPTAVSGVAADLSASLSWLAPSSNGGATISDFTIQYSSDSGATWATFSDGISAATSATVTGLTNGTSYVFRVAAVNAVGHGAYSATSSAVTPAGSASSPTITSLTSANSGATVTWSAPASNGGSTITAYEIVVTETSSGTDFTVTVAANVLTTALTGMSNGVEYLVMVRAVNAVAYGAFSNAVSVTPATTPSTSGSPTASADNAQASLTWTAPASTGGSSIVDYVIQYSSNSGTTWVTFSDGTSTATSATVTGLTNGTSYVFRVAAVNAVGQGAYSTTSSTITPLAVPTAPLSVAGTSGNASIAMTWSAPASNGGSAITDYVVQYFSLAGSTWATFNDGVSTATSATITGLTNGTAYMVRVAAVNSVGQGTWSALIPQITPATTPGTPTALSGTALALSVSLSWTAPVSNGGDTISDYTVQYSANSGTTWTTFSHAASNSTSITVTGLSAIPYVFRVAAVNAAGQGSYTAASASMTPSAVATVPGAPTGVTGTAGSSQVSLSWTAPANIGGSLLTDYTITYSSNNWVSSSTFPHAASTATSIIVTGLTNGTTYQFKVAAVNSVGQGPFSTASANRTPVGVPGAPVITSSSSSGGDIEVVFSTPANNGAAITDYLLRCVSSNGGALRTKNGTSSPLRTSLDGNGRIYSCTVTATNSVGTGAASNAVSVTTT